MAACDGPFIPTNHPRDHRSYRRRLTTYHELPSARKKPAPDVADANLLKLGPRVGSGPDDQPEQASGGPQALGRLDEILAAQAFPSSPCALAISPYAVYDVAHSLEFKLQLDCILKAELQ